MESVLGRVLVMVVVGVVGGVVAIVLVRAEARQRPPPSSGLADETRPQLLQKTTPQDGREVLNAIPSPDARADVPRVAPDPLIGHGEPQAWHSPNDSIQSRTSMLMTSREADQLRHEVDFFDEVLTVLRRKLLSHGDGRVVRSEGGALGEGGVSRERHEEVGSRHRLRHPKRKAHHRRFDQIFPGAGDVPRAGRKTGGVPGAGRKTGGVPGAGRKTGGVPGSGRVAGGGPGPVWSTPAPASITKNINEAGNITGNINSITESVVSSSSNPASSVSNFVSSSSNPASEANSIVSSRSLDARDSFERAGRGVAAEVEEAVLLAVPLSLLLTLLLLLCVACCCCYCRCRTRHDHDDDQEPLTSDQHDQWTTLGLGVCEACLPDISYQVHVAKKTRSSRKRRPDQSELVLEGDPEVTLGSDEVTCHPPLYTLLSNLPPGSSRLEDDLTTLLSYDSSPQHRRTYQTPLEDDLASPGSYSRPRRSHSLEFLAV